MALTPAAWNASNLKACLLDFGGTLDADGIPWQDRFHRLYAQHDVPVDREAFRRAFYHADDTLTENRTLEDAGLRETVETQATRVWERLGLEAPGSVLRAIIDDFLAGVEWYAKRNRPILEHLGRRYRLGIVSNSYGNMDRLCRDLDLHGLMSCIIDSNRVGAVKPDPRIFRVALDALGVEPAEAVYVGDNPYRDMEGARDMGMPHVWLASEVSSREEPCCPNDPVIRSLEELPSVLLNGKAAGQGKPR